jgi:hypothetical protein
MKTPRQLKNMINAGDGNSFTYNNSRTIKDYLDKPLVAYGVGYRGFVCVMITDRKKLIGYRYGIKSRWTQGWEHIDYQTIIKEIRKGELFIEKMIDEEFLKSGKIGYVRPILAEFKINEMYDKPVFRVVRLKSGKLRAERNWYGGKFSQTTIEETLSEYKKEKDRLLVDNMPKEILKEIESQLVLEAI